MEPRNCQHCSRLFLSAGSVLCPSCLEAEEEGFERVRLFLLEHPGANIEQVSRGTGIPPEVVLRYLQQGRLQTAGKSHRKESGERRADSSRVYLLDLLEERGRDDAGLG